jgi:hypothetical protein
VKLGKDEVSSDLEIYFNELGEEYKDSYAPYS